jgi:hypothetical protein
LREALKRNPVKWQKAIVTKLNSFIMNGTWELDKLPVGRMEISSKWVFKTKVNVSRSLNYKAQLVVQGFEQKEGLDTRIPSLLLPSSLLYMLCLSW